MVLRSQRRQSPQSKRKKRPIDRKFILFSECCQVPVNIDEAGMRQAFHIHHRILELVGVLVAFRVAPLLWCGVLSSEWVQPPKLRKATEVLVG
jgi:hypothetical protein